MKLELDLYFKTPEELTKKFFEVIEHITNGKYMHQGKELNYNILLTNEPWDRIEEHGGVKYYIYKSKLNND